MSDLDLLEHPDPLANGAPVAGLTPETAGMLWKPAALTDRILVATDGSRAGGAALRMARELVKRAGGRASHVRVVTVLRRPAPRGTAGFVVDTAEGASLPSQARAALARVRRQVRAAGIPGWELHVEFGSPAQAIRRAAAYTASTMIVMGIGRHGAAGRLLGADTVRRVAGSADVSVLAVGEEVTTLGHSAVAAVDFSGASARAARTALGLLEPPATLYLVHARPRFEAAPPEMEGLQQIYMTGVETALADLRSELPLVPGVQVGSSAIPGAPDAAILDFARRLDAGFIAVGRHGHPLGERLLIGSTTNALLAGASCPVLVTPPVPPSPQRRTARPSEEKP